jgi:RNA-directed DNA polymerase
MQSNLELMRLQAKLYDALKTDASNEIIKRIHNEILTSFACRALAVRRVTTNKGGKTAGVDGKL